MTDQQTIALIAPPILIATMYPVFRLLARAFQGRWRFGWYFGLAAYWVIWGAIFPLWLIGPQAIARIVQPQAPDSRTIILVILMLLLAAVFRRISGTQYEKPNVWFFLLLLSTNLGNGFFEELLWRGVYMEIFPESLPFRILWPSLWFGLWHVVPGSVSPEGKVTGLVIGSALMGLYLSSLAATTGTIWWTIVAHAIGGFIMIL